MKYFYIIIIVLYLSSSFCFAADQIELSSRTGKTISFESQEYFGLFPEIKDYKSATLNIEDGRKYFLVNTAKLEVKIPVSDSSSIALRFVIDNFEEIVRDYRIYKFSPNLLTGLIKVNYRYNRNSEQIKLVMKDKSEISGYALCLDTSHIVITNDTVLIPSTTKFRVVNYRDIYSIPKADYPIIDGSAVIWEENRRSISEKSLLINTQEKRAIPPEAIRYISENPRKEKNAYEESNLDFDDLHQKKMSVSLDISLQRFNLSGLIIKSTYLSDMSENTTSLFSFHNYYSAGMNFDFRLLHRLKTQVGYNYETIDISFGDDNHSNTLKGNSANLTLYYTFWNSNLYLFQPNQYYANLFIGTQLHWFKYKQDYPVENGTIDEDINNEDITDKVRMNYKLGLSLNVKYVKSSYIYLAGFINYHSDYGFVRFYKNISTRYINYIFSFGGTIGFGIEL